MKWYILTIFLVVGLSISGLLVISFSFDPYESADLIKYLFFASLFMAIWGLSTLALNKFETKTDWIDFYKTFKIGFIISVIIFAMIFLIRWQTK